MNYKKQYLKYKLKYLTAKKLFGGSGSPMKIDSPEPAPNPPPEPAPNPVPNPAAELKVKRVITKPKKPIKSKKKDDSLPKEVRDMRKQMGTPNSKNVKRAPKSHEVRANQDK